VLEHAQIAVTSRSLAQVTKLEHVRQDVVHRLLVEKSVHAGAVVFERSLDEVRCDSDVIRRDFGSFFGTLFDRARPSRRR